MFLLPCWKVIPSTKTRHKGSSKNNLSKMKVEKRVLDLAGGVTVHFFCNWTKSSTHWHFLKPLYTTHNTFSMPQCSTFNGYSLDGAPLETSRQTNNNAFKYWLNYTKTWYQCSSKQENLLRNFFMHAYCTLQCTNTLKLNLR